MPPSRAYPSTSTSPASACSRVLLPAPLGPMTASTSPGSAVKAGVHPVGDPEVRDEPVLRDRAHGVPSQWSRSATSTPIETTSMTRLSDSAASWSDWRVT